MDKEISVLGKFDNLPELETGDPQKNFEGYKLLMRAAFGSIAGERIAGDNSSERHKINDHIADIIADPNHMIRAIDIILNELPKPERTVIRLRFALDQTGESVIYPDHKHVAIFIPTKKKRKEGKIGSTTERVKQLEARGLRAIRNNLFFEFDT